MHSFAPASTTSATLPASGHRGRAQADQRPATVAQRQTLAAIAASPRQAAQRQAMPNRTGLPDQLKAGVEHLSGHSLDDVKVHYNSARPAHLQAHAYAQGTDIHLAPGQQQHLPHEAWHIAQQKQGRVKATTQLKGVGINDNAALEQEATRMGERAARLPAAAPPAAQPALATGSARPPAQLAKTRSQTKAKRQPGGRPQEESRGVKKPPIRRLGRRKQLPVADGIRFADMPFEKREPKEDFTADPNYVPTADDTVYTAEEKEMNRRGEALDLTSPFYSAMTGNAEKFGKSTPDDVKEDKISEYAHLQDMLVPSLSAYQEVGPEFADRMRDATLDYGGGPRKLGDDFRFDKGFRHKSGTYGENYTHSWDPAVIHNAPKKSVFDRIDRKKQKFVPYTYNEKKPLLFGKEAEGMAKGSKKRPQTARTTSMLTFQVPNQRYNMRPATKDLGDAKASKEYARQHRNLKKRKISYEDVNFMHIHTSPSISTINRQLQDHSSQEAMLTDKGQNVQMGGDFYAEKGASRWFKQNQKRIASSGRQTNFPGKGKGQNADMFRNSRRIVSNGTVALPPRKIAERRGLHSPEDYQRFRASPKRDLQPWRKSSIDHAPVFTSSSILPRTEDQPSSKKRRRNDR